MNPNAEAVQLRSYLIWENEGRPQGRDMDHWLQAETELASEAPKAARSRKAAAAKPKKAPARKAGTAPKRKAKSN